MPTVCSDPVVHGRKSQGWGKEVQVMETLNV